MLNEYLSKLVYSVAADNFEYENSMIVAKQIVEKLIIIFPEFELIKLFGSLTRRTNLSKRIDKNADIDLFFIWNYESYLVKVKEHRQISSEDFADYLLTIIGDRLVSNGLASTEDLLVDFPSLNINYKTLRFQITSAVKLPKEEGNSNPHEEHELYIFDRNISTWERDNEDLMEPYLGAGVSDPHSDIGRSILTTNPFLMTDLQEEYNKVYGEIWRALVITMKYWKFVHQIPISSFVIEQNVLQALENPNYFVQLKCKDLFDFLQTILSSDDLMHADLFNKFEPYLKLKIAIKKSTELDKQTKFVEAIKTIGEVLPLPEMLNLYSDNETI